MPRLTTALDRARQQLGGKHVHVIAELLYRCDKGNDSANFKAMNEDCRAVYLADALMMLSAENRLERIKRVQAINAHEFALRDDEREAVERNARQDVIAYGPRGVR